MTDPERADPRRALGARGEALAAALLARAGYRIAARNVRAAGVELDLVAVRGGLVVVVEVKTRSGRGFGAPEEAVDALEHRDWRVQSEAVELIRVLHRRSSIPFLIERLAVLDGRLRDDVGRALNSLTGQKFAPDAKFWQNWWAENRDTFVMPAEPAEREVSGEKGKGGTHFYGI